MRTPAPLLPEGVSHSASNADWGGRATRAEVDLGVLASNCRALSNAARGSMVMAVLKADAYGHGALRVAQTALESGAEWLAVYTPDEAVVLRRCGITARTLILGPFGADEAANIWTLNLTPTVVSLGAAECLQKTGDGRVLPVHVEVDTGLTRSGIPAMDAVKFVAALDRFPALRVEGIFTHFVQSDERFEEATEAQMRAFQHIVQRLEVCGHYIPIKHAANSGAIVQHPETHLDLVRAGISLYGYYPSPAVRSSVLLNPVLRLLSSVVRLQRVESGTGVGYGHEFRTTRRSVLALVPIGYGDGLPRCLGNGVGNVLVQGCSVPIAGNVSMDQISVDVTDVPEVTLGDDVVIIGRQGRMEQTAADIASAAGTIPYDILSGIAPRVPRLYTLDGSVVGIRRFGDLP